METLFQLALSFVNGIGPKTAQTLLSRYGSAERIFKAPVKELRRVEGMNDPRIKALKDPMAFEHAEKEMAFASKHGIRILFYNQEGYPKRLMECHDAPLLLYYKGMADLNAKKIISIIGTRKNTDYGERVTIEILDGLTVQEDLLMMSGLALGIDTIAHKASLKTGIPTVGVLGHSLEQMYPASNRVLAKEMILHGGLLSEFPSGTKPDRQNFPVRNRIVAGISDLTLVIESEEKGGAMITAYLAHSYNREVAAVPGRVFDSKSSGPNYLIRKTIAAAVTSANDVLELMGWQTVSKPKAVQQKLLLNLTEEEQKIVDALQEMDSLHSDELLHHTGFTHSQLSSLLLQLEMMGVVKTLPGKCYRLI